MKESKFLAVLDIVTFGIPVYIWNLVKKPSKTLKLSIIIFPITTVLVFLLSH